MQVGHNKTLQLVLNWDTLFLIIRNTENLFMQQNKSTK